MELVVTRAGWASVVAEGCGPLGPTMNDAGEIAFRGMTSEGAPAVFLWSGECLRVVASAGEEYAGFQGLPVTRSADEVVFRADLPGGGQSIRLWRGGEVRVVAETGGRFASLANFPSVNRGGAVAFAAIDGGGRSGVYVARRGAEPECVQSGDGFESLRGALIDGAGRVVVIGTPTRGRLGVHRASGRVIGIGDTHGGSEVVDFALNPVSVNSSGELAIRIRLADGTEHMLANAFPNK
jgi:hypothetical protein